MSQTVSKSTSERPKSQLPCSDSHQVASVEEIRSQFPALERQHNGQPVAYFDGPGGTQVPRCVAETVTDYLYHHNANTHWNYPTSAETDAMLERARETMAEFVGGEPDEIVFGANATTLAFHVSRAMGRALNAGDEVVITELDHHANVGPWQALAREYGRTLQVVKIDTRGGVLDWDDFGRAVNSRTKLIAIGAASNALGTINDIQAAAELAKSVGALTFVDAVHFVPHQLADVRAWGCDFLVCSAYKFYGPHVGAMWCRREVLNSLPFAKLIPASDRAPDRAETGTLNHEGIVGAAAAVDFLASLTDSGTRRQRVSRTLAELHHRSLPLVERIWNGLTEIEGVKLHGPPPNAPRTSTVSFTIEGVRSPDVATQLADRGVFVSHGDFYAHTVIERLGVGPDGLVRAGCACYTTAEEVERLVSGVREISVAAKR